MRRRSALVAVAGALASGCGYALQGRGITTDPSVKRIGVPLFKDRSGKPGLDARVTQAVMEELLKRGRFTVVRETANVDAVVEGEIQSWNVLPVGFSEDSGVTQASRYAISLTASVVYRKIGQKEPLWSNDAFSQRDEYDMGDNASTYFDREEQSIERLAASFARSLVAAMLEAF
ncbi:MAG TPA: LPS assembly lipoprotein LptE [Vicinamibacteria bacterium]|nr:LPS assembly lipoprotein LptE [Vicinamibacteria bacterium]